MEKTTEEKILLAVADIQDRMGSVEGILDRISVAVVDIKERVDKHDEDLTYLKDSHDRTFRRIDDFLSTLGRHESEIAALRSSRERLEARIIRLEEAVGITS